MSRAPQRKHTSVHPHARGDNANHAGGYWSVRTVHPHARGDNARRLRRRTRRFRFTPTRVGTTQTFLVHVPDNHGSPPRAWGQPSVSYLAIQRVRFTPTRVGTTHDLHIWTCPRAGSPPRAWGQPSASRSVQSRAVRFTPTRVGTTCSEPSQHQTVDRFTPTRVGTTRQDQLGPLRKHRFTPTRVGTTAGRRPEHLQQLRFTPTRVGTTCRERLRAAALPSVHPHARGDNSTSSNVIASNFGSPPRAWGQR